VQLSFVTVCSVTTVTVLYALTNCNWN